MPAARRALRLALPALACVWLLACTQPMSIRPGTPTAEVVRSLGLPTGRYALPDGGARLQYSLEPSGQTVFNVDLDASGHVVRVEQALSEALYDERIRPNVWTSADALREYGRPAYTMGVHNFVGTIWVWRYLDKGLTWRLLYIDIDPGGVVRNWSIGDEPLPDGPD
jgi:hypothetical protein